MTRNANLSAIGLILLIVLVFLLAGCGFSAVETVPSTALTETDQAVSAAVSQTAPQETAPAQTLPPETSPPETIPLLTAEDAQAIALTHAGIGAELVTHLRCEFEIDHGTPEYDVEFRYDGLEYEYEIHAGTGEILSFEKDR